MARITISNVKNLYNVCLLNLAKNQQNSPVCKIVDKENFGAAKALGVLLGKSEKDVFLDVRNRISNEQIKCDF